MSCSSNNCSTSGCTSCTCCHVSNVTIDNQLCVGGTTVLTTNTGDGNVLLVSSCCTQSSGTLVKITGTSDQRALSVCGGQVTLDPDSASGGALTVTNSQTQSSDELVKITGATGHCALEVSAGSTNLQHTIISTIDCNGGAIDGTAIGASNPSSGSFTGITLDPNNANGGAITVNNSATHTSGNLVEINGSAHDQKAVYIAKGSVQIDVDASVTEWHATSQGDISTATGGLLIKAGVTIDGTDNVAPPSSTHAVILNTSDPTQPDTQGALLVNGGAMFGGKMWGTSIAATHDATSASAGIIVGGGAVIENNLILHSGNLSAPSSSTDTSAGGTAGEIRIFEETIYLHTGSEWRSCPFSIF